jgi:hypothetical protein
MAEAGPRLAKKAVAARSTASKSAEVGATAFDGRPG